MSSASATGTSSRHLILQQKLTQSLLPSSLAHCTRQSAIGCFFFFRDNAPRLRWRSCVSSSAAWPSFSWSLEQSSSRAFNLDKTLPRLPSDTLSCSVNWPSPTRFGTFSLLFLFCGEHGLRPLQYVVCCAPPSLKIFLRVVAVRVSLP